jgi:hypothetical protein
MADATANSKRTVEFDRERLEIVKRHIGDLKLTAITRTTIEGFQAKRQLEGASDRTVNMEAITYSLERTQLGHLEPNFLAYWLARASTDFACEEYINRCR